MQNKPQTYAAAGVDIDAGARAVELMKEAVRSTHGPEVLAGIGAFGGLFDASALAGMKHPVLCASTDGVGTKTQVAAKMQRWNTIGHDLVNHCVNDILVQGARPLFFMDYVAADRIDPQQVAAIVEGIAATCRENSCALLGGETAEMPGVYHAGQIDLAGTIVGVVERDEINDGCAVCVGDSLIGLPSSGLHTNGYSLARRVLGEIDWTEKRNDLGSSIGEALLEIHRCYRQPISKLREAGITIKGLAHITGGGIADNLRRVLPPGVSAEVRRGTWAPLPIFELIQRTGKVSDEEMFRAFNMGIGMIAVVAAREAPRVLEILNGEAREIGKIIEGHQEVQFT